MKKGKLSTQDMLGIKNFSRNGIQTNGHGEIVYFLIKPTNISVLSRTSVGIKIRHLMQLLSAQPNIEIICLDARENFEDNKMFLHSRLETETNHKVRELLERDKVFLDEIQVQMSTAREFMFAVRLRNESDEQSFANLNRIEKTINEQGFDCTRAEKDDVKRILSRYFGFNTDEKQLDDHDGDTAMEKWIIPD
ncbi:MAG: hypothetical protein IJB57_11060 [Clostridia bacterium]|nr:hypothetical protein [Clostridia bacterium]